MNSTTIIGKWLCPGCGKLIDIDQAGRFVVHMTEARTGWCPMAGRTPPLPEKTKRRKKP